MARLNLQLFAEKLNTKESIVDYLKSQGKDSSMSARKEIAKDLGIKNYSGTAEQNIQMLKTLKSQSSSASSNATKTNTNTSNASKNTNANASKNVNTNVNTNASSAPVISGADQNLANTINSTFAESDGAKDAQSKADVYENKMQELTDVKDIISQDTWNALNSQWNGGSSAYQEAWATTQQQLEALTSGRTSYTDQIKDMMDQIMNREKFQYDVSEDTMFQQMLSSSMASGQSAMADTIGQASALTGGYASTYATSAGNQAYNAYIQDAYNNLPEYYNMALEAYQMEGQEMYNQLAMLNDADATEYGRMYDSWQANFTTAQQMYNQEYGAWQDSVNNAYNSANLQLNEYGQLYDMTYNTYNALQDKATTMRDQEYQMWQDTINNAWKTVTHNEGVRQYNESLAEEKRQHDESLAETKRQHDDDMTYKNNALAQDQSQFVSMYDYNGDGKVDSKDTEYKAQMDAKENKESAKTPSTTEYRKALEYYNEAVKSGDSKEYNAYLASLEANGIDVEMVAQYIADYGDEPKESFFEKWLR